ncbi:esterase-like activity of phytase family protein [Gramella jeungdoensis]|uniref:Esterase-like activity of phytase family protein n=1 Tax=Gramella jeungdoensis TaxID=708091 RepID=A0ABT0YXH9_9FLAO|nr:esterase-like activity of phytase family protein [Gramella jeungdoensis]MCM8568178.1 esterase-like activity of phytase family protein [Gramella jeungdoensis]
MKKFLLLSLSSFILTSCAVSRKIENQNIEVAFLDEYVLDKNLQFKDTEIGGISGIDFKNGYYFLVSDQASNPRIYKTKIEIQNNSFDTIYIEDLLKIDKTKEFSEIVLDLEAIRLDSQSNEILVTSEGSIDEKRDPGIFRLNENGKILESFSIPEYFQASGEQKPRHNGVFEGLTETFDKSGFWVATELPLERDGAKPKIYPTRSHIRLTKFDKHTGEPIKQYAYKLDGISKLPINYFAVNGVTEILEYAPDRFLVLERAFSAGYGSHGNTVKIFDVDASKATNTLNFENLKKADYQKVKKSLIFNFKSVEDQLTDEIIDNIEGMCFGPELSNGKKSLILVADNNFNTYVKQLNQFILLAIDFKK